MKRINQSKTPNQQSTRKTRFPKNPFPKSPKKKQIKYYKDCQFSKNPQFPQKAKKGRFRLNRRFA